MWAGSCGFANSESTPGYSSQRSSLKDMINSMQSHLRIACLRPLQVLMFLNQWGLWLPFLPWLPRPILSWTFSFLTAPGLYLFASLPPCPQELGLSPLFSSHTYKFHANMESFIHNFYYPFYANDFQIIIPTPNSLMRSSSICLTEVGPFLLDLMQSP